MKITLLNSIRLFPVFIFTVLISNQIHAQDMIITELKDTIYCKIMSIDSDQVNYSVKKGEVMVNASLKRSGILDYRYQYKYTTTSKYQTDSLNSLNILLVYKKANGKPAKILKKDGSPVTSIELKNIFPQNDKEAYALYKAAKKKSKVGLVFVKVGAGCLGASIGYLLGSSLGQAASSSTTTSGQTTNSSSSAAGVSAGLALVGVACIGVGLSIGKKANKKIFKALKIRNDNFKNISFAK
jgi:hypothetical protein